MKPVLVLGSTGSVGENALRIVRDHPGEFRVVGLAARANAERLAEQAREHRPRRVALADAEAADRARRLLRDLGIEVLEGEEGVVRLAGETECERAVQAISGAAALRSTWALVERGKTVALANKESLVAAGPWLLPLARLKGASILPVDSEHGAIFQCLRGERIADVRRVYLTASGGPFRDRPLSDFAAISPKEALRHPNWSMGPRITVDSATMANKALEVLEAHHLFGLREDQIAVLLHPQSIVHSMVEFTDGSIVAQLGVPDMRIPIYYALHHPERGRNGYASFDPKKFASLTFEEPDPARYPALALGYACVREGGFAGAVLNAADEVAVERFLKREIAFPDVVRLCADVLARRPEGFADGIEGVFAADRWAREAAAGWRP